MTLAKILCSLFLNIVGSLIGVIVGLYYSRWKLARMRLSEKRELRRKLIKTFQFNAERLKQMQGQLVSAPGQIPDYRLDTESVSHILFHGRDLFDDEAWFDRFNWQRFQLVHINAKVDFLNDLTNLSGVPSNSIFAKGGVGQQRYASLVGHLGVTQKEIASLISDYERCA